MVRVAILADAPAIKALLDQYKQEILSVASSEITKAIVDGRCLYERGVVIIYRRLYEKSYYGVPLGHGAYQILYIASTTHGDGSAKDVLTRFFSMVKQQVFLLVKSDNPRAIKFYERHGFYSRKEIKFKTFSSLLMVKSWP